MMDAEKFRQQMRSEWKALRSVLEHQVDRHFHKQEMLIAALGTEYEEAPPVCTERSSPLPPVSKERMSVTPVASSPRSPRSSPPESRGCSRSSPQENGTETPPESPSPPARGENGMAAADEMETETVAPSVTTGTMWPQGEEKFGISDAIRKRLKKSTFKCMEWWLSLEEPPRRSRLARFVHGPCFEAICLTVIIVNCIFAALAANLEEDRALHGEFGRVFALAIVEILFLAFYCVELALRIFVHQAYFFVNEDMSWNIFDTSLVAFTVYDEICNAVFSVSAGSNMTFMRSLRILKMAKILRVVRVMRYFSELRLILQSIVGSMASLLWSIVMLALIFYIFALCFVQGMTIHLMETFENLSDGDRSAIVESFGTVQDTIFTLYKAATGGDDWSIFYRVVALSGSMYALLFIFYIAFIQIAVFNILTAIFVENAMKLAQPDRDAQALEVRKAEMNEMHELRKLCKSLDINNDGSLDVDEFHRHIAHGKLKAYLHVLGLEVRDAEVFLKILSSAAHDEPIQIDAFVDGCMRMKGGASSIDLQGLAFETKIIHKTLDRLEREMREQHQSLTRAMRSVCMNGEYIEVDMRKSVRSSNGH